tara:strand:- start:1747 stop:1980 length:234 start_codon:yes stop_codon:yes gene_type:complete
MFFKNLFILLTFLIVINCSKPSIEMTKCNNYKKTSQKYLQCMNNLVSESNIAANAREFKKHKSLKSFFKQVEVIESD